MRLDVNNILTADEFKALRQRKNVSQATIARALGIQRSYISQFENRRYLFDGEQLFKLRCYLDDLPDLYRDQNDESDLGEERVSMDETHGDLTAELNHSLENIRVLMDMRLPRWFIGFGIDEEELAILQWRLGREALKTVELFMQMRGERLFGGETKDRLASTIDPDE